MPVRYYVAAVLAVLCAARLACALPARSAAPAAPMLLAYRLSPGESLRYRLSADIKASVPLGENAPLSDLNAVISVVYVATPRTRLADGTMDVEFKVEKANLELEKIPVDIPLDQVQKVLNQTVTLASTGEVKRIAGGDPVPFAVSVPGVDPKRLYALLFPIVFQNRPVRVGDSWSYKSELLGSDGANPTFAATVLPPVTEPHGAQTGAARGRSRRHRSPAGQPGIAMLREVFGMKIDQSLTADRKPVTAGEDVHRKRQGQIDGHGIFRFDLSQGRMTQGTVTITANVRDDLVGKPLTDDEPRQTISKVEAKVNVELQPAADVPVSPSANKDKPPLARL